MKGNQAVELADYELRLIKAIDHHMEVENCCGRLVFESWSDQPGNIGAIFRCQYCQDELLVSII